MKKIIVLAGPSAVGKTTLADYMIKSGAPLELVRSATTRAPRGDGHDAEYLYFAKDEFVKLRDNGGMLECTEYAGAFYGTPVSEIERIQASGKIPLLILDIKGVESIKKLNKYPSLAAYLFDDINVLEKRLYDRYLGENPTVDGLMKFQSRKERNLTEFSDIESISLGFDMLLDNSDLASSSRDLLSAYSDEILEAQRSSAVQKIKNMIEQK